ncbi:MAG: agmatine deiminase family protein [Gammaproteobacteria bacterium]|nr:agmatine deiminase family protein [Gammaproteobacteria bacterium]
MLVDASEGTLPLILAETKRFYAGIKDANTLQVIALRLDDMPLSTATTNLRVPAEWEVQEAIWLQWPGSFEQTYEPAFAQMSEVISRYQKLHILVNNNAIETRARAAIVTAGGDPGHSNITWHSIANDSAWMRDNGPVYVTENGIMRVQNWEFDAWGGGFDTPGATVPYANDNLVPNVVGSLLGMNVEQIDIVQERGNLEFNGKDTLILNWSVIGDPNRNPNYTREQATADMKQYFGVSQVIWVEGWQANDLTRGNIDGIARFISQDTVVVGECLQGSICYTNATEKAIYDNAATTIEDAGFTVIREPFDKSTNYNGGENFDIDYMNWLVGNGFVIAVGFEDTAQNAAAAARLKTYYPNRDIFVIDMLASWDSGGGAHCHTNDQPAAITSSGHTPWLP